MDIDEEFCGQPTNVGIGSRYPLTATANFTSEDHIASALGVVIYKDKVIAVMGTQQGHVIKVGKLSPLFVCSLLCRSVGNLADLNNVYIYLYANSVLSHSTKSYSDLHHKLLES